MNRLLLVTAIALCLTATGCRTGQPKELSGRHRQPINVQAVNPQPATTSEVFVEPAPPLPSPTPALSSGPEAASVPALAPPADPACRVMAVSELPAPKDVERIFRVFFAFGDATLTVPADMKPELLSLAQAATRISIKGRTDAPTYNAVDEQVAMRRAIAMRSFLIQHGIPATRIDMQFASAADYLADNNTQDGRGQNRRVEVLLDFVKPSPEVVASTF